MPKVKEEESENISGHSIKTGFSIMHK
jgi:hypothetical protein